MGMDIFSFMKKNKVQPNERLNNLLDFSRRLIAGGKNNQKSPKEVFTLIKMLVDKISCENICEVIESKNTLNHNYELIGFNELSIGYFEKRGLLSKIFNWQADIRDISKISELVSPLLEIEEKITISLSKDPVLPAVWKSERLCDCLLNIGTSSVRWKEDKINHFVSVWLPMGITLVNNGNHSIATGILKQEGELVLGSGTNHEIYDISELYNFMYFDGIYYCAVQNGRRICRARNFDFGCIFEIGRLLCESGNKNSFIELKNRKTVKIPDVNL